MTPEMRHALNELQQIEALGLHIPARSRDAIITAILSGCYGTVSAGGITIDIGDLSKEQELHTAMAKDDPIPGPSFGL